MSFALTAKQHRIASAIANEDNALFSLGQIAEQIGVPPSDLSTNLKRVSVKMGLVAATETGHVSRIRLMVAAREAGGFDQLAANLGLLNRDRETVQ
jgi:DNA-binding MarR family transcriptional regulator